MKEKLESSELEIESTSSVTKMGQVIVKDCKDAVEEFLNDLGFSGRSRHTIINYRSDLIHFFSQVSSSLSKISSDVIKQYLQNLEGKALSTKARKQASLRSFFEWCIRNNYLLTNPVNKVERIKLPEALPRGIERKAIQRILDIIPRKNLRDRLLFTLTSETGLRISEALGIYHEDLILTPDDEKIIIWGKGNRTRTVMLYASPESLKILKRYLHYSGIKSGALFRGDEQKGGSKKPIHYRTAHYLWTKYCKRAGITANIHALRHSFATELINGGVSLAVIRKLLGHKNIQTTLRYAEVNDNTIRQELMQKHRRVR
jgi:site-specific recombinase XerD